MYTFRLLWIIYSLVQLFNETNAIRKCVCECVCVSVYLVYVFSQMTSKNLKTILITNIIIVNRNEEEMRKIRMVK